MKNYVLGFIFDKNDYDKVLIKYKSRKEGRFEWQNGLYNGVGGKVSESTSPIKAMIQKAEEDTGIKTNEEDWEFFTLISGNDYKIYCFSCFTKSWLFDTDVLEKNDEISVLNISSQLMFGNNIIPDLMYLIPLAIYSHKTDYQYMANIKVSSSGRTIQN